MRGNAIPHFYQGGAASPTSGRPGGGTLIVMKVNSVVWTFPSPDSSPLNTYGASLAC